MHRPTRRRAALALVLAGLVVGAAPAVGAQDQTTTASPAAATTSAAVLPAPTGVTAERLRDRPNDFVVSWKPVAGAVDHYNVSVKANGRDDVRVVPATATSLTVTGVDRITTYRITVSSRDVAGAGTTSGTVTLNPLVPGAPTGFKVGRSSSLTDVIAGWTAPAWSGYGTFDGYAVKVRRLSDGVLVFDKTIAETSFGMGGLDPKRTYALSVAPVNAFGSGPAAATNLTSQVPGSPTGLVVARDQVDPALVRVSWAPPAWTGTSSLTGYEVVYGPNTLRSVVKAKGTSAEVTIPYTITGLVAVRACNASGCGYLGQTGTAPVKGATIPEGKATTTNPFVGITASSDTISVETRDVIGSKQLYPRLYVRVLPTVANGGFTDAQWGQNGAQVLTFGPVPKGTYTTVVYGVANDGKQTELARKVLVFGDDGIVRAAEWRVVRGKATITAGKVDMPFDGENRVLSTRPRTTQDLVLRTNATLHSGWGYGVWFRASIDTQNLISGYSFQYDPKYGNKFLIRHWSKGTECSAPLATSPFPAGFKENIAHELVVVAKGDTVFATVDGHEVFRVASLKAAIAASPCKYPAPTGTEIGFRTWSTSPSTFVGTTFS